MRPLAMALIGVLLLAGCGGGGGNDTTRYDSPKQVADALNKAGVVCAGYHVVGELEQGVDQQGECFVNRESTTIFTFKDNGQRDNWIGLGKTLGCSAGKSLGISTFSYVMGDRWVVQPESETETKAIADRFEGKPVVVRCPS